MITPESVKDCREPKSLLRGTFRLKNPFRRTESRPATQPAPTATTATAAAAVAQLARPRGPQPHEEPGGQAVPGAHLAAAGHHHGHHQERARVRLQLPPEPVVPVPAALRLLQRVAVQQRGGVPPPAPRHGGREADGVVVGAPRRRHETSAEKTSPRRRKLEGKVRETRRVGLKATLRFETAARRRRRKRNATTLKRFVFDGSEKCMR